MAFTKGNKLGKGRPKGSQNKVTSTVRETIEKALGKSLPEEIIEGYLQVKRSKPAMALKVLEGLMKYCYPTLQSITVDAHHEIEDQDQVLLEKTELLKQMLKDEL